MKNEIIQFSKRLGPRSTLFQSSVCALVIMLVLPAAARATDVTVSCNGGEANFTKIQDAVDYIRTLLSPPAGQYNHISLGSDCHENVVIKGQTGLWIGQAIWPGNTPSPARITALSNNDVALSIVGSHDIVVVNVTVTGGATGLKVTDNSSVQGISFYAESNQTGISVNGGSSVSLMNGSVTNNSQNGISIQHGSVLGIDGNLSWWTGVAPGPFLISGNGNGSPTTGGIYCDGELGINGGVTIQDNSPDGIFGAGGGKILAGAWHDENVIQYNDVGLDCWESAQCITWGNGNTTTIIKNNKTVGVRITYGGVGVFTGITTIEGNGTAGLEVSANSHARLNDQTTVRNNGAGSSNRAWRGGILVDGNSEVLLDGSNEVSGNSGPGIFADINSSLDITNASISGNSEEGIRLKHMSVGQILLTAAPAGNGGGPLVCDSTSMAVTNLAPRSKQCSNIDVLPVPKLHAATGMPLIHPTPAEIKALAERLRHR